MAALHTQLLRLSGLIESAPAVERHLEAWIEGNSPEQLVSLDRFGSLSCCATPLPTRAVAKARSGSSTARPVNSSPATIREPRRIVSSVSANRSARASSPWSSPSSNPIAKITSMPVPGHDDTLDRKISKHTTAMIAVPFYFGFGLRGWSPACNWPRLPAPATASVPVTWRRSPVPSISSSGSSTARS